MSPKSIAFDSVNNNLYVAEWSPAAAVDVISGASNTVTATIPVGTPFSDNPRNIAVDTATNQIYVPNDSGNNVTVIDAATGKTVASIVVKPMPFSAVYDSSNGYIYVGDQGGTAAWISVINGATRTLVTNIDLGPNTAQLPEGLALGPSNNYLYAGNSQGNNITVLSLSTDKVVASIPVGDYPASVTLDTSNSLLYAANTAGSNVSVVDTTTNVPVKSIAVNSATLYSPTAVTYDAATGCVYAPNGAGDAISIINTLTNANIGTIPIQGSPTAIAVDSSNGNVYVTYTNTAQTASYVAVLAVSDCPAGSVLSSVSVAPLLGEILLSGGSQTETATATCSPSPCPGAVTYSWSISNTSLAHLSSTSSNPTSVIAGGTSGAVNVFVNASLNGFTVAGNEVYVVLIVAGGPGHGNGSSPPGFLDLPGSEGIILLGVLAIVVVAVVIVVYSMGKRKKPMTSMSGPAPPPAPPVYSPSSPPPPPPPPPV